MNTDTLLGLTAGALTTMSLVPQAIKIWRSQSAKDISVGMFGTLLTGLLLWICYGFSINSLPVIITNIVSFMLAFIILSLKIKFK
jgi:MtN3 and saliva related transmembrane protein